MTKLVHVVAGASVLVAACGDDSSDAMSPTVVEVTPGAAMAEMWLHQPIVVTFSEPIDPASISPASVSLATDATLPTTTRLSDDGMSLTVTAPADAAAVGALHLALTDGITDLAGNALAPTGVDWTLAPWSRPALPARGSDPWLSSLALLRDGTALLAVPVGSATARRVVVNRADPGGWTALGGELGTTTASLPSIAVDAQDRPVVVWSEGDLGTDAANATIQAARWDGGAWVALPSPGEGALAVIATPEGGGDPMIAWASANAVIVRRLVGDAWEPVPGAPDLPLQVRSAIPALSLVAHAETPALGVVVAATPTGSPSSVLRVFIGGGNGWTEAPAIGLGPTPAGANPHARLAAAGTQLFAAFDAWSGHSFSVHVARRSGSGLGWELLGNELDVDPPANAMAPAIAIDATGAPVVAWRELVESQWRGFVMRWDGGRWTPLGGDAWNTDPGRAILLPELALAAGRVPVVAWGDFAIGGGDQQVHVGRWNGPATPRPGLEGRPSLAGCAFDGTAATLSATGCFTIANGKATPHAGLVPFDIVSELWTDGALKRRWLALPDGGAMTMPSVGAMTAPAGTMIIKEFAFEMSPGDPSSRRVMETRFLIQAAGTSATWSGFSFRWRADGSDADLLPDASTTVAWPLTNGQTHTHFYPSRQNCQRCHHASNGPLLGLRAGQLKRHYDYGGVVADQMAALAHVGAIAASPDQDSTPFAAPHDPTVVLEQRVRGYLAANCSHCHNPGGERPTRDFRWETPLAQTNLCGVVTPGNPSTSLIYQRVSSRPGMPPLGTLQTDPVIINLLGAWISSISTCP